MVLLSWTLVAGGSPAPKCGVHWSHNTELRHVSAFLELSDTKSIETACEGWYMEIRGVETEGLDHSGRSEDAFLQKWKLSSALKERVKREREGQRLISRRKSLPCGGIGPVIPRVNEAEVGVPRERRVGYIIEGLSLTSYHKYLKFCQMEKDKELGELPVWPRAFFS